MDATALQADRPTRPPGAPTAARATPTERTTREGEERGAAARDHLRRRDRHDPGPETARETLRRARTATGDRRDIVTGLDQGPRQRGTEAAGAHHTDASGVAS